ncbi:hypothetical protein [Vibrio lentus]|uniref:hypothetical protein n=1 Tax=Vibrio lentus TaxID=136468 RepID=UPI000C84CAFA|nr:hypothetical protein [Vibrio lentus]PMI89551.1 hypothetical protein BCU35_05240 [Vibrio lentus]
MFLRTAFIIFTCTFLIAACNEDNEDNEEMTTVISDSSCDLESVNLLDFEAWQREEGWWVGEYTFLGGDGNPNVSSSWPYRYDHYKGFIHLEVIGNSITQRNVFLYPPNEPQDCTGDGDIVGQGVCGKNGNEKIFSADQSASNCNGGLAGSYTAYGMTVDTATTLMGKNSVLYQVYLPNGDIMQNQLTTLPPNNTRVRTAQGFFMNQPTYASFYRENKVTKEEFIKQLAGAREEYKILEEDFCGYDSSGQPSQVTCTDHFGVEVTE